MRIPRHRRSRSLAPRVGWSSLQGTALVGVLALVAAAGPADPLAAPRPPSAGSQGAEHPASSAADCSREGAAAGGVPTSALIRTTRGAVRQVSFEVGWDVYTGRRPGSLIAVCPRR